MRPDSLQALPLKLKKRACALVEPKQATAAITIELEPSQLAADVQAADIIGGDRRDNKDNKETPAPELDQAAEEGVSFEDFEAVASVRYRACLSNPAKHPLVDSDSSMYKKVSDLQLWEV